MKRDIWVAVGCVLLLFAMVGVLDWLNHGRSSGFGTWQEGTQPGGAYQERTDDGQDGPQGGRQEPEEGTAGPGWETGPDFASGGRGRRHTPEGPGDEGDDLEAPPPPPAPWEPPVVVMATDLHYFSLSLTDFGEAFWEMAYRDDGKVIQYNYAIVEAFLEEVQELRPDALVLSGDLTLYGEKVNHEELSGLLRRVQETGIRVLVIPGNHDINHPWAVSYFGSRTEPVETVDGEGFREIYREFGYGQAVSRDPDSLSYLYQLDEKNCFLMLDSCQYDPENRVGGRIREETFGWIEQQLEYAKGQGWRVTPVSHHNLLDESRLYTFDCTIENNKRLIRLLESYGVEDYFSGHLHAQRSKKHRLEPGVSEDAFGIREVVGASLSIPPCQYGVLRWDDGNRPHYEIHRTDVEAWARRYEFHNDDLLDFASFSTQFMDEVISRQVAPTIKNLPEEDTQDMAMYYAQIIRRYSAGESLREEPVDSDRIYQSWKRNQPENRNFKSIESMLRD